MSKAAELAALIGSQSSLSNRNFILNGGMQVAQRGTSFTTDNVYTIDRWKSGDGTGGSPARTLSQEAFALGQTAVPNAHYYLRHNQTGASTNGNSSLVQKIEDVTRFDGNTVTLSFYAKADAAMDVDVRLIQEFGTGGSPSSDVTLTETVSIGTSWTKHTVTKTLGSLSGKTLGTDGIHTSSLTLDIEFQPTSTFTFEATLFQLELGEQATPFEHRSYGDELAACQRYYYQAGYDHNVGLDTTVFAGVAASTTLAAQCYRKHPVEMRTTPTMALGGSVTAYDGDSNTSVGSIATNACSNTDGTANFNTTQLGAGRAVMILLNDPADFISFDSEL